MWFGPDASCTVPPPGDLPISVRAPRAQPQAGPALRADGAQGGGCSPREPGFACQTVGRDEARITAAERGADISGVQHVSGDAACPSPTRPRRQAVRRRLLLGPRAATAGS